MPETRQSEIEQLKAQLDELKLQLQRQTQGNQVNPFVIPDPIKNMSEFSGNRRELSAWLEELDEIYDDYVIKGHNGAPDTFDGHYIRAIKNKIRGEARTILCANGNPKTIAGIKAILLENYGDQKDLTTNLSLLFHLKKGDKTNIRFFNEIKEINTKLKSNLQTKPLSVNELLDIITISKYLDNIAEPLASIIRQSNPSTLETAYQAVCVNQNAETRNKPVRYDKNQRSFSNFTKPGNSNNGSSSHPPKPYYRPPIERTTDKKTPTHRKMKVEANVNELGETASEHSEEEIEEVVSSDECDELNFQRVRVIGKKT